PTRESPRSPPPLLGRHRSLVRGDPAPALAPLVSLPPRREQRGRLLQSTPQQLLEPLQTAGQTPRPSRHPVQAGRDLAQPVLQLQSRGGQRRQGVVGQGGADRGAVALHDLRLLIVRVRLRLLLRLTLDPADAPPAL